MGHTAILDDQITPIQFGAYMVPAVGSESDSICADLAAAEALFDRMVPKVSGMPSEAAAKDNSGRDSLWAPTSNDYGVGDADVALLWQPGRLPDTILRPQGEAVEIFKRREWCGWSMGNAFRTGQVSGSGASAKNYCRPMITVNTTLDVGMSFASNPGYIMWYLNIPAEQDDDTWDAWESQRARDLDWENLNFMAPNINRVSGSMSIAPSIDSDWLRWTYQFQSTDDRQWVQLAWDFWLEPMYRLHREPIGLGLGDEGSDI